MKALVTATCVAILAATGYFFWGEYKAYAARTAAEKRVANHAKYSECMDVLVEFKNGGFLMEHPASAENKAKQCADFVNQWHGLPEANRIAVDADGVTMVPLN